MASLWVWVAGLLVFVGFPVYVFVGPGEYKGLLERIQPNVPFGFVRIENGWAYLLGGLLALALIFLVYSYLVVAWGNARTGAKRSFWPLFGQSLVHLLIWLVLLFAYYPIVQILAASFDPSNSLYSFRAPNTGNLLLDARVIPDFSKANLENYAKLLDGIVIQPYQWLLLAVATLTLLVALGVATYRRFVRDTREHSPAALWQSRTLLVFALAAFGLIAFLTPSQFTSQATEGKFLLWVRNTLFVSGLTGVLAIVLTATAGYAFARFSFPGRYGTLLVFIFIQMFPGFLGLVAIYYLISGLGLLNTYTGLVMAYSGGIISFGTWVYKGFLESISKSLEEAALIDGASKWQAFTQILLPLSLPMFVFIFLLQFVGTYSEFIVSNLLLSGADSWTVGMGLRNFTTGQFQTKWGLFAAAAVLGSLPILSIFYGFQRFFVSGYTAGGVKE